MKRVDGRPGLLPSPPSLRCAFGWCPQFCIWIDGLNALVGKDMVSELTKSDLDTLLSMEMKLRLLDLENVQIPEEPPPVPKEPSSYDFVYHYG